MSKVREVEERVQRIARESGLELSCEDGHRYRITNPATGQSRLLRANKRYGGGRGGGRAVPNFIATFKRKAREIT